MEWAYASILILGGLFVLLIIGMPIAFALGLVSVVTIFISGGHPIMSSIAAIPWGLVNSFVITAAPLFILMSEIVAMSGQADTIFSSLEKWIGNVPGSLLIVSIGACTIFGAVSGTGIGVAAIVGLIAIPEMLKRGYNRQLATSTVAASSALGMLIPPSMPFIFYGIITETSIGKLFIAGIFPGLLVALMFSIYIFFYAKIRPQIVPASQSYTWREKFASLKSSGNWAVLSLVALMIGGIYFGMFTPTEAAGVGCTAAVIIALAYKKLNLKKFLGALSNATKVGCMCLLISMGALLFSYALCLYNIPQELAKWVVSMQLSKWLVFTFIMVGFLALGMFFDVVSCILISMPILFPIVQTLGFDPIWFGVVVMVNMLCAVVTPPVGLCVYVVKGITPGDFSVMEIFKGVTPFIIIDALVIVILCVFPEVATFLPNNM